MTDTSYRDSWQTIHRFTIHELDKLREAVKSPLILSQDRPVVWGKIHLLEHIQSLLEGTEKIK